MGKSTLPADLLSDLGEVMPVGGILFDFTTQMLGELIPEKNCDTPRKALKEVLGKDNISAVNFVLAKHEIAVQI
ncbi:hypothetical protein JXR01_02095 [Candidatus Kaiserbacteria bacterium]|nr:MAG: hypothetical protein JXR01_02095 [Candidatus Kaiserbacteria bacterium]